MKNFLKSLLILIILGVGFFSPALDLGFFEIGGVESCYASDCPLWDVDCIMKKEVQDQEPFFQDPVGEALEEALDSIETNEAQEDLVGPTEEAAKAAKLEKIKSALKKENPLYSEEYLEKRALEIYNARNSSETDSGTFSQAQKDLGELFIVLIKVLVFLNWMVISLLGVLMDNLMVYNPLIAPFLKNMWQVFRNLANVSFAVLLIVLVIYSAFSSDDGLGALKRSLGKFVIALVLLNFSWTFVKIVVDAGTILTEIVYRIPIQFASVESKAKSIKEGVYTVQYFAFEIDTKDNNKTTLKEIGEKFDSKTALTCNVNVLLDGLNTDTYPKSFFNISGVPNYCFVDRSLFSNMNGTEKKELIEGIINDNNESGCKCLESTTESKVEKSESMIVIFRAPISQLIKSNGLDGPSLSSAIAANYLPLEEYHKTSPGTQSWSTFIFEILFSSIFAIMTSIIFIALGTALFIRLLTLWLMIMLSPLAFLLLILEDFKVGFSFSDAIGKLFHVAVVVPAGVGLVFSMVFIFVGELYYNIEELEQISSGIGSFWYLILGLVGLGALWIGTFKVLESESITGKLAGSIKSGVQGFAGSTAKNLSYMPLLPGGKSTDGGAGQSRLSLAGSFGGLSKGGFSSFKDKHERDQRLEERFGKQYVSADMKGKIEVAVKNDSDGLGEKLKNIKKYKTVQDVDEESMKEVANALQADQTEIGIKYRSLKGDAKAEFLQIVAEQKLIKDSGSTSFDKSDIRDVIGNLSLKVEGVDVFKDLPKNIANKLKDLDLTVQNEYGGYATKIKRSVGDSKWNDITDKMNNMNADSIQTLLKNLNLMNSDKLKNLDVNNITDNGTITQPSSG